ncbi:hypothetical protein DY000_02008840 [Brassica cretica]|uniref:Uncharacterized protein n=1 Tax=Brassica cretica TaxID=69181 RepID=A0ABQ7BRG8_BRACR|nr:hypothetical protein DY000_02008840 [Brassica cretica]
MVAPRRSKFEDVPMEFDKNNAQELAAQMKPQKAVAVAQKPSKIQKCGCTWKRDR